METAMPESEPPNQESIDGKKRESLAVMGEAFIKPQDGRVRTRSLAGDELVILAVESSARGARLHAALSPDQARAVATDLEELAEVIEASEE
jgi:hypothetical protein